MADRIQFKGGSFQLIGTVILRGCEPELMGRFGWPWPFPWMFEVRDLQRQVIAVCLDPETANQALRDLSRTLEVGS